MVHFHIRTILLLFSLFAAPIIILGDELLVINKMPNSTLHILLAYLTSSQLRNPLKLQAIRIRCILQVMCFHSWDVIIPGFKFSQNLDFQPSNLDKEHRLIACSSLDIAEGPENMKLMRKFTMLQRQSTS